jgi:hypothetical protein
MVGHWALPLQLQCLVQHLVALLRVKHARLGCSLLLLLQHVERLLLRLVKLLLVLLVLVSLMELLLEAGLARAKVLPCRLQGSRGRRLITSHQDCSSNTRAGRSAHAASESRQQRQAGAQSKV